MNDDPVVDDGSVTHLLNLLSGCVLLYAGVTRGSLLVARAFERLSR